MLDSQNFVSGVFKRGEGHGHGVEIVEAIEAFDPAGKRSHQCR